MSTPDAWTDATALVAAVRAGDVTPRELAAVAIARIEKLDPELHALVSERFEAARREAAQPKPPRGLLAGVPLLLKDLGAHLAGDPCHNGMRALKEAHWTEPDETHFARRLREAGAVILGRTNTPELGLLPTTEPAAYGATRNPWDPERSPGGSSGGAGAAVASGMVPVAHASDGGGSIRIPAAHCGLVGLKPTRGRNSFGPQIGERWGGFSAEGFVTRSVRDTALLLDVTSGPEPGDPYAAPTPARRFLEEVGADPGKLRIGLLARGPRHTEIHAECRRAAEETAKQLEALGHHVEESHPEALDDPEAPRHFVSVIAANVARALEAWGEKLGKPLGEGDVEPLTWAVANLGREVSVTQLLAAIEWNHGFARRLAAWWSPPGGKAPGFDLLLTPTTGEPPPRLGEFEPQPGNPLAGFLRAAPFSMFTGPFNVSGQPAISLPIVETAGSEAGLPLGSHLVAPVGREDLLLRVASQLEQALPWAGRKPRVSVAG